MNISLFVQDLIKRGAKLWTEGDQLHHQGPGEVLTPEVLEILKQHKSEFLDLLRESTPEPEEHPLSSPQREIWFDQLLYPDLPLYNIGGYTEINGTIDRVLFEVAVKLLIQRHDTLRTKLASGTDEVPMQTFFQDLPVTVPFYDFSQDADPCQTEIVWMKEQFIQPFELERKPLFRFALLKVSENQFDFWFVYHHLIIDGWGISLITQSLAEIYTQLLKEKKIEHVAPSYLAFVKNDRAYIESERYETDRQYWIERYQMLPGSLFAPRYSGQFVGQTLPSERRVLWLPRPFYNRLLAFAKNTQSTLFHVMLGALYVYFTRTTQRDELAIGLPVLNRSNAAFKETVGLFIGVCAAWFQFGTTLSFRQLIKAIGNVLKSDYRHQRLPISELNRAVCIQKMGRMQLFDIQLNYAKHDHDTEFGVFKAKTIALTNDNEQNPLSISIWEFHENEKVQVDFVYNLAYFESGEIERIQSGFIAILEYVLTHVDESISTIPLITESEQQQLQAWNQTETDYPKDKTIVDLFQEQVEKTPDNIAVVFDDRNLTYRELNAKANQLAHYLLSLKTETDNNFLITDNCLVGICVDRSFEMVIGLLAVLKAGGAYLPLDPESPERRLQFMLEDSQVPLLLSQSNLCDKLPVERVTVVCLDSEWGNIENYSSENPTRQGKPEHFAYVIYTSGSTGKPKGCQVTDYNVTRLFAATEEWYHFNKQDIWTLFHSFAFDFFVWELWGALFYGGKLVVVPYYTSRSPEEFYQLLIEQGVTVLNQTPSAFQQLISVDNKPDELSLRLVIFGGEALDYKMLQPWFDSHGDQQPQLFNMYGITETTVHVTCHPVTLDQIPDNNIIGRPVADLEVWVLDAYLQCVPIGVSGEMYVSGAGVTCGYLNRPELTGERFIIVEIFGKYRCLYKTGDRARWLSEGNLEYLGRLDHQIKLRGFRIELGEIEATLRQHEAVLEAVVVLYSKEDDKRIIAYVTKNNEQLRVNRGEALLTDDRTLITELRTWLKARLPEYMVPSGFTVLDTIPLTQNGKIDRKKLKKLDIEFRGQEERYVVPRIPEEELLCVIWVNVLNVERVGIYDNFFELGGHSLIATQLVSRIRESFEVEMPLRIIFEHPVLHDQAEWLDAQQRPSKLPSIVPLTDGEPLVLSFAQQRLWFLAQLEGQSATYNMPAALRLDGELDHAALERSMETLVKRHDSLRLCFPVVDGQAAVEILDDYNPLTFTDLSGLSGTERQRRVDELIEKHAQVPFDITTGPLLRSHLVKFSDEEHIMLFNMHHIISDGWSMGAMIREWSALYRAYYSHQEAELPELSIRYTDYAAWQRNWLSGDILERQLSYWQEKLSGAPELLELPTDYPRPAVMSYRGAHLQSRIPEELTQRLKCLSREQGVTLYMTLLTAFNVLLCRYSGQEDILVGSPIANRTHRQTEEIIGFFVNTLVLRTLLQPEQPIIELLKHIRQMALEAYAHQDIPFEYLVEQLNPTRSLSHSPLFQVMFVLQNAPIGDLDLADIKVSYLEQVNTTTKFDLTLNIAEQGETLVCDWEYRTDLFNSDTIERMTEHFQLLLEGIVNKPTQFVSQLPLLTATETQRLQAWNHTETDYPKDKTIVDLFEEQVEKTPDNIAVVFEDRQLTYRELNRKANQLAHYLLSLKTGTDNSSLITDNCLIGICMERSLEMVIGLLGILKAGCTYVPLDPEYPVYRLQFMLEDCQMPLLLSQSHLSVKLPTDLGHLLYMDTEWEIIETYGSKNPDRQSDQARLAYVIYTSGSTGQPKGVCVPHRAVIRLTTNINYANLDSKQTFLQNAPISFDAATLEIWGALLNGARLVVMPAKKFNLSELSDVIQKNRITILWLTSSLFNLMLDEQPESLLAVKQLLVGGEELSVSYIQRALNILPNTHFINGYGPTENTTFTTCYSIINKNYLASIPIGIPIANTQIYILDTHHNLVPLGIPGELCVAGIGLASGYLNRPELTAKKFIEVELFGKTRRIYKTGDLARWLPDGNLEFLGRLDNQIKLRGFRIEPGEIETTLCRHEAINEAIVVLNESDGNKRLVAYLTLMQADSENAELTTVLNDWLKTRLPHYMLPSSFTVLEQLPLTPNGKIDRKALAESDLIMAFIHHYTAPRTDNEQYLTEVWQHVLKQNDIGIHDNFFQRGGDSILSIQIVSRARTLGLGLSPRDIFQHQSIAELAQVVRPVATVIDEQGIVSVEELHTNLQQSRVTGIVPLLPVQRWFFYKFNCPKHYFNVDVMLKMEADVDIDILRKLGIELLKHHDALRMTYRCIDGKYEQRCNEEMELNLSVLDLTEIENPYQEIEKFSNKIQASFDLEYGPLIKFAYFKLINRNLLFIVIHHLVVDGISSRILLEDLINGYQQAKRGGVIQLAPKTSSYKEWAEALLVYAKSSQMIDEKLFWRKLDDLSLDLLPEENSNGEGKDITLMMALSVEYTQKLFMKTNQAYNTQINDIVITALVCAISNWSGIERTMIDITSHGRPDIFGGIDVSRTVGWFISIYPVLLDITGCKGREEEIISVKEHLRKAKNNGIGYGILKYLEGEEFRNRSQIIFNYLGQWDLKEKNDFFELVEVPKGMSVHPSAEFEHELIFNGFVENESFKMVLTSRKYGKTALDKLLLLFKQELTEIITFCAEKEKPDIPNVKVS
jgi:amino acid adenylation domain-containing protein/non-ribosomal peptide synthase protein (TIGR01720 family)